ncbi:MAG: hypothetical protein WCX30_01585 [Candidatus Paceibacterota bacterium]|jgi:hypothetical protein|nr:hypothetical protein [bacterium]
MEIVIAIPREDRKLVEIFLRTSRNGLAKLFRGGTFFELAEIESSRKQIFDIPKILLPEKELKLYIKCYNLRSENYSIFSFGVNGDRLAPFHLFTDPTIADAVFFSPNGKYHISFARDDTFLISRLTLMRKGRQLFLNIKEVWSGYLNEAVPEDLDIIRPMILSVFAQHKYNLTKKKAFIESIHIFEKIERKDKDRDKMSP